MGACNNCLFIHAFRPSSVLLWLWKLKGNTRVTLPDTAKCNTCQAPKLVWEKTFRHMSVVGRSILTVLRKISSYFRSSGFHQAVSLDHPVTLRKDLQHCWTFYLLHPHNSLRVCLCLCGILLSGQTWWQGGRFLLSQRAYHSDGENSPWPTTALLFLSQSLNTTSWINSASLLCWTYITPKWAGFVWDNGGRKH